MCKWQLQITFDFPSFCRLARLCLWSPFLIVLPPLTIPRHTFSELVGVDICKIRQHFCLKVMSHHEDCYRCHEDVVSLPINWLYRNSQIHTASASVYGKTGTDNKGPRQSLLARGQSIVSPLVVQRLISFKRAPVLSPPFYCAILCPCKSQQQSTRHLHPVQCGWMILFNHWS